MTKYAMVIDSARCFGCESCVMACKVENNLPDGVWWNHAVTEGGDFKGTPAGDDPSNLSMLFHTMSCQHCDNPACVNVCPTGATYKRESDGIVMQNPDACIGCRSCIMACPYDGVRTFVEDPKWSLDFAVGDVLAPQHVGGTVEKCTFCVHRIDRGERPACVDICRVNARFWGDLDDPESEVSKLLAEREYKQINVGEGTGPNMYVLTA